MGYYWLIFLLTGLLCLAGAPEISAQEKGKSKYEKRQERKNRKNRRLKRSPDKAKSNKEARRAARFKMRTRQGEKAYKGDISGRRLIKRGSSKSRVTYAQPDPYAGRKMSESRRVKYRQANPRYSRRSRERTGRGRIYSGGSVRTTFAGKKAYKFEPWLTASKPSEPSKRVRRIVPRSASGAYVKNKRAKPYAFRERSRWENAYQGDIAGRKFRTKRTTDRPSIQGPPTFKNRSNKRRGDKAYSGKAGGGYVSATRRRESPYFGNVKQRRRLSATRPGENAYSGRAFPRGNMSITRSAESASKRRVGRNRKLSVMRKGELAGTGLRMKGGGSISGGRHNNKGRSIQNRGVQSQDIRIARHQGTIRTTRGLQAGGSISARMKRNNRGRPLKGYPTSEQDRRVAGFQGNTKLRSPSAQGDLVVNFSGNMRARRPEKNKGRSLPRNSWNNKGKAIANRPVSMQDVHIASFKGNSKGRRKPEKGAGGSVSVLPWNNNEKPLEQKVPGKDTRVATSFQGRQKRSFRYVRNPSSHEDALKVKPQGKGTSLAARYEGSVRRRVNYEKKPLAADGALKGIGPSRAMVQASQYQGNIKMSRKRYKNRHPSYKFEDTSRNAQNKRRGFDLKLWWSKLFKKQENQPSNLKEKERKPRFDKGEKGLWND